MSAHADGGPGASSEARGARLGPRLGREAVLDFGDVAAEAAALRSGAGVVPLLGLSTHAVAGRDARGFLHRMLTQDVKSLVAGAARPALFLDVRGRVQADLVVWGEGDRFLLVAEPAAAAKAMPALERYVIADDVTVVDEGASWAHLLVAGPRSAAVADAARATLAPLGAHVSRVDLRARPAVRVLAPVRGATAALDALVAAGAALAGEAALDVARVEALVPWFGVDLDERVLANEAALDASISWTKGCYLGQEPVVMAKHRGRPPTLLVRAAVDAGPLPPRDEPLVLGGGSSPVGRITTAVARETGRGPLVLAFVRHEHARDGVRLSLGDGRSVTIEAIAGPSASP